MEKKYTRSQKVKSALQAISKAIDDYQEGLFLAYNGGKDSTVVLNLAVQVLLQKKLPLSRIKFVFFDSGDEFEQTLKHIDEVQARIGFDLMRLKQKCFKKATTFLISEHGFKAILMGSRREDPYCSKLQYFSKSDNNYPDFMRVNPIIDWSNTQVWEFLLGQKLKYCSLYDEGFSYVGQKSKTVKNPLLSEGSHPATLDDEGQKLSRAK